MNKDLPDTADASCRVTQDESAQRRKRDMRDGARTTSARMTTSSKTSAQSTTPPPGQTELRARGVVPSHPHSHRDTVIGENLNVARMNEIEIVDLLFSMMNNYYIRFRDLVTFIKCHVGTSLPSSNICSAKESEVSKEKIQKEKESISILISCREQMRLLVIRLGELIQAANQDDESRKQHTPSARDVEMMTLAMSKERRLLEQIADEQMVQIKIYKKFLHDLMIEVDTCVSVSELASNVDHSSCKQKCSNTRYYKKSEMD